MHNVSDIVIIINHYNVTKRTCILYYLRLVLYNYIMQILYYSVLCTALYAHFCRPGLLAKQRDMQGGEHRARARHAALLSAPCTQLYQSLLSNVLLLYDFLRHEIVPAVRYIILVDVLTDTPRRLRKCCQPWVPGGVCCMYGAKMRPAL